MYCISITKPLESSSAVAASAGNVAFQSDVQLQMQSLQPVKAYSMKRQVLRRVRKKTAPAEVAEALLQGCACRQYAVC